MRGSRVLRFGLAVLIVAALFPLFTPAAETADDAATTQSTGALEVGEALTLGPGAVLQGRTDASAAPLNLLRLEPDGTLRLLDDPFYYDSDDHEHLYERVIEVRNPKSEYPDFRLPITRDRMLNADSKLVVRSANMIETNDPAELNLLRTGSDNPEKPDENAAVANGAVVGLIRWLGRRVAAPSGDSWGGFVKDAELIARNFGTSEKDHYGALFFQIFDHRYKNVTSHPGVLAIMKPGVRIGHMDEAPGEAVVGAMFEVDAPDSRPVILRRPELPEGEAVALALATGRGGTPADDTNTLARIQAAAAAGDTPLKSQIEFQTNKGNGMATDWVLPVPLATAARQHAQAIESNAATAVIFENERADTHHMCDVDAQPTRLTCTVAGYYQLTASAQFAPAPGGLREAWISLNGDRVIVRAVQPALGREPIILNLTSAPIALAPGDYVELLVRHSSPGPVELQVEGYYTPVLSLTRVG